MRPILRRFFEDARGAASVEYVLLLLPLQLLVLMLPPLLLLVPFPLLLLLQVVQLLYLGLI